MRSVSRPAPCDVPRRRVETSRVGNYRQHLGFATAFGVIYAVAAYVVVGIHLLYGAVALFLTTMSGLLPDLDSDSGVEMKSFTGVLGVLAAVTVWDKADRLEPRPSFEMHLLLVVLAYTFVRHGLRRVVARLTVHRGISHSVPMCLVWGIATYLYYPSTAHPIRLLMATAVTTGFMSHLLLDEICSVDLQGARVNKAFGTAIKFWAPSPWSTLAVYGLLAYLAYRAIDIWPPEGGLTLAGGLPKPEFPWLDAHSGEAVQEGKAALRDGLEAVRSIPLRR